MAPVRPECLMSQEDKDTQQKNEQSCMNIHFTEEIHNVYEFMKVLIEMQICITMGVPEIMKFLSVINC